MFMKKISLSDTKEWINYNTYSNETCCFKLNSMYSCYFSETLVIISLILFHSVYNVNKIICMYTNITRVTKRLVSKCKL